MTNEEIIEMAREVNLPSCLATHPKALERFAKLVAEKEREACIKIVMQGTGEPIQRKTLDILQQERTRIALAIKEQK
jgi:hypothetical protein